MVSTEERGEEGGEEEGGRGKEREEGKGKKGLVRGISVGWSGSL